MDMNQLFIVQLIKPETGQRSDTVIQTPIQIRDALIEDGLDKVPENQSETLMVLLFAEVDPDEYVMKDPCNIPLMYAHHFINWVNQQN